MIGYIDIGAASARVLFPLYDGEELSETIVYKHKIIGRGRDGFLNEDSLKVEFKQIAEELRSELDSSHVPPCCVAVKDSAAISKICHFSVRLEGKTITKSDVLYLKKSINLECDDGYIPLHRIPVGFRFDDGELLEDPIGQSGDILTFYVLLVAARYGELATYAAVLNKAGIKVHRFIYDGLAHGLAAIRVTDQLTATVFDLGVNSTGVSVFSEGMPVYFGSVPEGMELLVRALVSQLRCSGATAENLIMAKGMAARGNTISYRYSDNKSDGSIDVPQFVNTLRLKLNIILQAARGIMGRCDWPEARPSYRHKIIMTGGGRGLGDLPRVSQQLLKVETVVARGSDPSDGDNAFMACLGMWLYMEGDDFGETEFVKQARLGEGSAGGLWQWLKDVFS